MYHGMHVANPNCRDGIYLMEFLSNFSFLGIIVGLLSKKNRHRLLSQVKKKKKSYIMEGVLLPGIHGST